MIGGHCRHKDKHDRYIPGHFKLLPWYLYVLEFFPATVEFLEAFLSIFWMVPLSMPLYFVNFLESEALC